MDLSGICVIEFSGESCANCITLLPMLHRILNSKKDVKLYHIEVSMDTKDIVTKYKVDRVPTILILKDEQEIARCHGYQPEEILEIWLEAKIEEAKKL